jgi:hypothetical protein
VPHQLCAGCRKPIDPADDEILDLADDNRVHIDTDHRCLIAWGRRWRAAAHAAIRDFERGSWGASLDLHPASQTAASAAVSPRQPTGKPVAAPSVSVSCAEKERGIER